MWTKAHRARHEARLKDMVRVGAVGEVVRWLERADPPRSPQRTPLHRIAQRWPGTCAWAARGEHCPAASRRGAPSMAGSGAGWKPAFLRP